MFVEGGGGGGENRMVVDRIDVNQVTSLLSSWGKLAIFVLFVKHSCL